MTQNDVPRPLDGIVVADFSRVLAGPLATMTLADLGATVIKVERPGVGDDTRAWGPPFTAEATSYFEGINRSKLSVALDLGDESDRILAKELARRADVLVENFRPGTLAKYGLGDEQVLSANPRSIYCSITGFGAGAGAHLPGYDFVVQAVGGLMSITGAPDTDPTKAGVALVDVLTGKDAVIGILAALRERDRTGKGQHIEVNLLSSLLGSLANQVSAYLTTGVSPRRMGNQHPSIAPYETLHCKDELLAIACGNDRQFQRLLGVLGASEELASDERFVTNTARVHNRGALVAALKNLLATDTAENWEQRIAATGIPVGRVGDIGSAIGLAEELGLSPTIRVGEDNPDQVRHAVIYAGRVMSDASPPPSLGQHDGMVRSWLADGSSDRVITPVRSGQWPR